MLVYLNEYHVAQSVYTFHGDSKLWLESIIKAQVRTSKKLQQKSSIFMFFDFLMWDLKSKGNREGAAPPLETGGHIFHFLCK